MMNVLKLTEGIWAELKLASGCFRIFTAKPETKIPGQSIMKIRLLHDR